jgi:hypothetical protein
MWLKLRWARFFTLAGWQWRLSPRPGFDFEVTFPCRNGECDGSHTLIVRVADKSYHEFVDEYHKTFRNTYREPNPALFGDGPEDTYWEMVHGSGCGCETAQSWTSTDANLLWKEAAHD